MMRVGCLLLAVLAALMVLAGCGGGDGNDDGGSTGLAAARLTAETGAGTTACVVEFMAEGLNADGNPLQGIQTRWDWDGDGSYETTFWDGGSTEHLYTTAGTHTARVQVRDAAGNTAIAQCTLTIAEELDPVAATVNVSPQSGSTDTIFVFSVYMFEDFPTLTNTRDQVIKSGYHRWDWDADGRFDTPFLWFQGDVIPPEENIDASIAHQFETPGVKRVIVQVRTGWDYRTDETSIEVTVEEP